MIQTSMSGAGYPYDIEIQGLRRHFGGTQVLRGLDLRVRRGGIFGLLGNNGAGKTTAIHCLLGLIPMHGGSARVLGLDPVTQRVGLLSQVGFFPERDSPYDWMRLWLLFRVGEAAYTDWDRQLCDELCTRFGLDKRKKIKDLSKGMVAKAKLIYALSHHPKCLILDEPTSGLDPGSRYELLEMLKALAEERGVTTLLSSHNLGDIDGIATDVGILHDGRLAFTTDIQRSKPGFEMIEVRGISETQWAELSATSQVAKGSAERGQCLPTQSGLETFGPVVSGLPESRVQRRTLSLLELFHFVTTPDLME